MSSEPPPTSAEPPESWPVLSVLERRILGVMVEKAKTTPDAYPMSVNAVVTGCNQKSNRDPVMQLAEDDVRNALTALQERRMAGPAGGADSRVTKYEHRLQEVFNFTRPEIAVLCVLLLRASCCCAARRLPASFAGAPNACIILKHSMTCSQPCKSWRNAIRRW